MEIEYSVTGKSALIFNHVSLTFQNFLEFSRIENCKVLEISRIIFWDISRKSLEIPRFFKFCFTRVGKVILW